MPLNRFGWTEALVAVENGRYGFCGVKTLLVSIAVAAFVVTMIAFVVLSAAVRGTTVWNASVQWAIRLRRKELGSGVRPS